MSDSLAIFYLGIIFVVAKVAGEIAHRFKLPTVLGEIFAGILLGPYLGIISIHSGEVELLKYTAKLALIFLLFRIGMESNLRSMATYGRKALGISLAGITLSFFLGFLWTISGYYIDAPTLEAKIIVSTLLIATSIGITARVLEELGKMDLLETNIILEASVMDDILTLLIFAVIMGGITSQMNPMSVLLLVFKIIGFILAFLIVGRKFLPYLLRLCLKSETQDTLLILTISLGLFASILAEFVGLAYIAGALLLGLLLSDSQLRPVIEDRLEPICNLLVPVFFVLIGLEFQLDNFSAIFVSGMIATIFAILGKIIGCGLVSYYEGFQPFQALRIGIAMIPRAEVPLVIATIALKAGIISHNIFSVAIFLTVATSIITVILLNLSFSGKEIILSGELKQPTLRLKKASKMIFSIKKFHIRKPADAHNLISTIDAEKDIIFIKIEHGMDELLKMINHHTQENHILKQIDTNVFILKPKILLPS